MAGYIKLNRKILEWEWYRDINTKTLFLHCLLKANWKSGSFQGEIIPRGSFATSVISLASETGLTIRQTRTALEHLQSTNELTIKTTNKYSVVTINNYEMYQDDDKQDDKQTPNKDEETRHSDDNNRRNKEYKKQTKEKKTRKEKYTEEYFEQSEDLKSAYEGFKEMRATIKKPLTDHAISLLVGSLLKLSSDLSTQADILDQSTLKCWQGVFPLKNDFVSVRERKPIAISQVQAKEPEDEISDEEFFAAVDSGFGEE